MKEMLDNNYTDNRKVSYSKADVIKLIQNAYMQASLKE